MHHHSKNMAFIEAKEIFSPSPITTLDYSTKTYLTFLKQTKNKTKIPLSFTLTAEDKYSVTG